jgi:hypothetical protein
MEEGRSDFDEEIQGRTKGKEIVSAIIEFLKGTGADDKGRKLDDILALSDAQLEYSHDIIQWLFPLNERSMHNWDAPVLTEADLVELKTEEVRQGILKAFDRFTRFYNNPQWLTPHNHNYLRLTRMLKCLGLAGLEKEKSSLRKALNVIYMQHNKVIGETTKKYWDEA